MTRRGRNIRQIERYVTILQPLLERATSGVINMQELPTPESDPPMNPKALALTKHADNVKAASILEPIFHDMILSDTASPPYILWQVLAIAGARYGDPRALKMWEAGETEEARLFYKLYKKALSYVVDRLEENHPGEEIHVATNPRDEPVDSVRKDSMRELRWKTEDSYRKLAAEIDRIVEEEQCTVAAAIGLFRDRLERNKQPDVCERKIRMARAFVKRETEIRQIMKEKSCSVEAAMDLYELRLEWNKRGVS